MPAPRFTISQFREKYRNDDACLNEIFRLQYQHVKKCPECKNPFNYRRVNTRSKIEGQQRKSFQCVSCGNQIYPLAGTIYEKSRTPLTYWFYAIYLMTATRNGVAAKELERQLGVTYKCAFRMAHRIRQLMQKAPNKETYLDGVVQIDECFVGGKLSNKHKWERYMLRRENKVFANKSKVLGMIQDNKKVSANRIWKVSEKEVIPLIKALVKAGSTIVTDAAPVYDS